MHELAKLLGSATLGAALGIVGSIYGKTEPGWAAVIVVGFLVLLSTFGLIYSARMGRRDYLDSYEDCHGNCNGRLPRRQMWRLPDDLHKKKGLPVCRSCFMEETRRSINPFWDRLAYAKKGEEDANTKQGKRERTQREENRRRFLEALNAPDTEESLRAKLMDPLGREHPDVRQALDALIKANAEKK
jgi:hypothetical protein